MADTTDSVVRAPPIFSNIPAEVREHIILQLVKMKRTDDPAITILDTTLHTTLDTNLVPYTYDISITASSFRCHTIDNFSLLFINKKLYQECIPVIFKNCSVVLLAGVTQAADSPGFIPYVLQHFMAAIKAHAPVVGLKLFGLIAPSCFWHSKPEPAVRVTRENESRKHLSTLIDTVMNEFPNRRALRICINIVRPIVDDLKNLYKLFSVKDSIISLEKVVTLGISKTWIGLVRNLLADIEKDKRNHESLAMKAAVAVGQEW
ncbi:hypothetical protein VTL71DRAFT_10346, partial [Oculimacula yallundae]